MSEDQNLTSGMNGDATAFTQPTTEPHGAATLTVEEALAAVRRPERTAVLYLRGDLLAEHDAIIAELSLLVDARGEVLDDGEASIGEESKAARAERLAARDRELLRDLAASAWPVRFRGMASDEWAKFHKAHFPKGDKSDVTDFNNLLIAETAIAPTFTVNQVKSARKSFGAKQITELANKAWEACNAGGVDVPKSPASWQSLAQR